MSNNQKRFALWLGRTHFGVWMSKRLAARVDPWLFRRTGGRFTSMGPVFMPQLVLTTRGRKTGQERDAQLLYTDLDGDIYVVASNFGGKSHPAWSHNLQADPRAIMQCRDERVAVTAEQLSDVDKAAIWERLCDNIPNYAAYRDRTDRNIRVYRLAPRDSDVQDRSEAAPQREVAR